MVDSGASMHMISRKDFNSAELETVTTSRCPTTVVTANAEEQTHQEARVHVRESDLFLYVKILEDTPAVLSLGKLCEDHGYSYEWTNGQKPCLIKHSVRIQCNTENYVPTVSRVYRRLPRQAHLDQHLRHHYRRKVQAQHLFQHQLSVRVQISEHGATRRSTQPKTPNPKKMRTMNKYGATRHFPKFLNGCKNSRRI